MINLTPEQTARINDQVTRIRATAATSGAANSIIGIIGQYLLESETQLIQLMNGQQPTPNQPGNIEFGLTLYILDTYFDGTSWGLPQTQITSAMLETWEETLSTQGVVYCDGTLVGFGKYEALDPGWLEAVLNYVELTFGHITKAPFNTSPATIDVSSEDEPVTIALVGDWGTGSFADGSVQCPAVQVINQIKDLSPDYVIHLGDVYYSGTASEESSNFLELWHGGSKGSFALNSNHEMYDGANGYFTTLLASSVFGQQSQTSYFAIEGSTWVIIGLDSAYFSGSLLFMDGAIVDSNQVGFLQQYANSEKKIIVLTHHNALTFEGTQTNTLWNNVCTALGTGQNQRQPDFWYWGHVHNGVVYSSESASGPNTLVRCNGYGAIPFGSASCLQNNGSDIQQVNWFANKAFQNPDPDQVNRVLNGFCLLTISSDTLIEEFYYQDGTIAWSNTVSLTPESGASPSKVKGAY